MSTRILSVFSLLKRVGLALLLLGGATGVQAFDVIWNRAGQSDSSRYGIGIVPLGDQDDDGFADWAVYAYGTSNQGLNRSYIEFFHGGNPPSGQPYMTLVPDPLTIHSFLFVRAIGNINGDGYDDWTVGTRYYETPDSVHVETFFGGPTADFESDFVFSYVIASPTAVYPMGDFNGDEFDDIYVIVAGFPSFDRSSVLFGDQTPDTSPDWILESPPAPFFQTRAESFGDLNGDGYDDFVSPGSTNINFLYVFHGSQNPETTPFQSIPGLAFRGKYIVNDLNGDLTSDLLLSRQGGIDIYWGHDSINEISEYWLNMSVEGSGPDFCAGLGDVNGDGYGDIGAVNSFELMGTFALFLGSQWPSSEAVLWVSGVSNEWDLHRPYRAAGLGDVNGDSIDDFMVTGTSTDPDGYRGRAIIFAGDSSYHVPIGNIGQVVPSKMSLAVYPNPFNSSTRISFALPPHVQGARLRVHDLLGREVLVHEFGAPAAGAALEYVFDGAGLPTGVYLVSVQAGEVMKTVKVMLLK